MGGRISEMNFTLTPRSPAPSSSFFCLLSLRLHTVWERVCKELRGNNNPENHSEQPAASESHHSTLSTNIILAPTSYGAPNISVKKNNHTTLPSLLVSAGCLWGVFLSFQFIPMNAEMNYPRIFELLGRRACLIRSNIWMIAIHCDSNYWACTHPQKHPIQSNWQLKCS